MLTEYLVSVTLSESLGLIDLEQLLNFIQVLLGEFRVLISDRSLSLHL